MSVMIFNAQDNVPPEGIPPEEFDALQERMAIIQGMALQFVEQNFPASTSITYRTSSGDADEIIGYDFAITDNNGRRLLCVKSTDGDFNNPIHISYNELLQMRESANYDLYRIYEVVDMRRARLRIAHDMQIFAGGVLAILEQLPDGIMPDSISVLPEMLGFGEAILLEIPEEAE